MDKVEVCSIIVRHEIYESVWLAFTKKILQELKFAKYHDVIKNRNLGI